MLTTEQEKWINHLSDTEMKLMYMSRWNRKDLILWQIHLRKFLEAPEAYIPLKGQDLCRKSSASISIYS